MLPEPRRERALLGDAEQLLDLVDPVDPERDHIRGPAGRHRDRGRVRRLPVPVLRAGGAGDPGRAARPTADVRYVWRHLPLTDVHPQAQLAAEAAEAAAAQGAFWPMHDLLLTRQDKLTGLDLMRYAARARVWTSSGSTRT